MTCLPQHENPLCDDSGRITGNPEVISSPVALVPTNGLAVICAIDDENPTHDYLFCRNEPKMWERRSASRSLMKRVVLSKPSFRHALTEGDAQTYVLRRCLEVHLLR